MHLRNSLRFTPGSATRFSFSLLELLVVFSIIFTLAALLLPALKSIREISKRTTCMNNMRQIFMAFSLYGDDKGSYPCGYKQNTGGVPDNDWTFQIQGYLTGYRGLDYSSNANLRSKIIECPSRTLTGTGVVNTYGVHGRLLGNDPSFPFSGSAYLPRRFPWTERAYELFLLADADQDLTGEAIPAITRPMPDMMQDYNVATAENFVDPGDNLDGFEGSAQKEVRWRHNNRTTANFLFVDGHVEAVKMGTLKEKNIKFKEGS